MNYEVNEGQTTRNEFVWIMFIDNFHKFNRLLDPQYVYFRCGKFLVFQYLFLIQFLNNFKALFPHNAGIVVKIWFSDSAMLLSYKIAVSFKEKAASFFMALPV